jgi:hypothetical protein
VVLKMDAGDEENAETMAEEHRSTKKTKKKRRGKKLTLTKHKKLRTPALEMEEEETAAQTAARVARLGTETEDQSHRPKGLRLVESDEEDDDNDYNTYRLNPADITTTNGQFPDYWHDGKRAKFVSTTANVHHQLTQQEVRQRFSSTVPALSRKKVLGLARTFQLDTAFMHRLPRASASKYNILFSCQTLLDLAAVADLRRPVIIETDANSTNGKEVTVLVSSYALKNNETLAGVLDNDHQRKGLAKEVRRVTVSVAWLQTTLRPDIAKWVEEEMFGTAIQCIAGSTGGADALSLAFSGRPVRDKCFEPVPTFHTPASFGKAVDIDDSNANKNYDTFDKASSKLCLEMRKEAEADGCEYMAPPRDSETQIVKLKWVPSTKEAHKNARDHHGGWRGAFAVAVGAAKVNVLQECGLPRKWVEENFSLELRRNCQAIAVGLGGKRNPKKYLLIPAGDVHNVVDDPPPQSEILTDVPVKYQQGKSDTCLRDSLASAIHAFGFVEQAKELSETLQLTGCNLELVGEVTAAVRRLFAKDNLELVKVVDNACRVHRIGTEDMSWPIVLVLMTSDGGYGSHAITVWKGWIFDSNLEYALQWSQQSLDWCSGADSKCIGFSRSFRLCPVQYRKHPGPAAAGPAVMYGIGEQVWKNRHVITPCLGWIMRLPSVKKPASYHVGFTDGSKTNMNDDDVATLAVCPHEWTDL